MLPLLVFLVSFASLVLLRPEAAPPPPPPSREGDGPHLFETADRCTACHAGVALASGEDVSIGLDWRASMMANAARDPYWQAAVRREVTDHPESAAAIQDKCATCHMPMARYEAHLGGGGGRVFANAPALHGAGREAVLAADGVSCSACHQIIAEGLGDPATFTGGFRVDEAVPWGRRAVLGPFETDAGRAALMRSATGFVPEKAPHVQASELCASCHTLSTHALDAGGREVAELPEQVPYLEWLESDYAGADGRSCQSCHMPVVREPVPVTGILGVPRDSVSRHVFRGGNFLVLGMLNRHRDELAVTALPQELDAAVRRTLEHLRSASARLEVTEAGVRDGVLDATVRVDNLGGHKLPTAYPSRRAWLHLTVRAADGAVVFESGTPEPDGSIRGNDADDDPLRWEPHHEVITEPDQVQVYETVMADAGGRVTTGLMRGACYLKDNRLLPAGFDKAAVPGDVAVHGGARGDGDFTGGSDRVRYAVPVPEGRGPFGVEVALRYQPVGYRWARNLADYDAPETRRFLRYWEEAAPWSGALLAEVRATVDAGD